MKIQKIHYFSEKANLAVTLVSSEDEVVASGAFFDYPNLAVNQAKWEKLFQESFESIKPTVSNLDNWPFSLCCQL